MDDRQEIEALRLENESLKDQLLWLAAQLENATRAFKRETGRDYIVPAKPNADR